MHSVRNKSVVAISSTEAEVVAANHSMRAEGIPMLALFEQLNLFKKLQGKPARDAAKPQEDAVFTRSLGSTLKLMKSVMGTSIQVVVLRTSTPSKPVSLNFIKSNSWRTTKRLSQSCPPVHQHPWDTWKKHKTSTSNGWNNNLNVSNSIFST